MKRMGALVVAFAVLFVSVFAGEEWGADWPMPAEDAVIIEGDHGFLFPAAEGRFLAAGVFWGERAREVSAARRPEWADPLPGILDFHERLASKGIHLLVVPVPVKASVYPENWPGAPSVSGRVDEAMARFIALLGERGVHALDLTPAFREAKRTDESAWFCKTDAHPSPRGIEGMARAIAEALAVKEVWGPPASEPRLEEETRTIRGDLAVLGALDREERIAYRPVPNHERLQDRDSEVLLIGDSNTLVYSVGEDMHVEGAGLLEHLSLALGTPIDRVGTRGSGANSVRIDLMRRRDQMAGKKVVIWVFGSAALVGPSGWRKVPVIQ